MNSNLVTLYKLVKVSEPKCHHQSWDNHDYFIELFTRSSDAGEVLSTAIPLSFASLLVTGIVPSTNWRFVKTLYWASLWDHFSNSIHSLMFPCHILVILSIFQTFSLLLYLSWWSVIKNKNIIYLVVTGLSCCMQDLVPWPGIELWPLALGAKSLSY